MKKSKFSASQVVNILKEVEASISIEDLSRQHGFTKPCFTNGKPSMEDLLFVSY